LAAYRQNPASGHCASPKLPNCHPSHPTSPSITLSVRLVAHELVNESIPWDHTAFALCHVGEYTLVAEAHTLSGNRLEQLVVRLQRHSGRTKHECWRFLIRHGLKSGTVRRRWTEEEMEAVREGLTKMSIDEVARKLQRTPHAVRNMLDRNQLRVREIRCDAFSLESLARALHIKTEEIRTWIAHGWLQAALTIRGRRHYYTITPEALAALFKNHLSTILGRGARNQFLFQAYPQYCYSPKHTVGEQLLVVRRDKRERAAFAALNGIFEDSDEEPDDEVGGREFHVGRNANGTADDGE
jgi:hypothetical protein